MKVLNGLLIVCALLLFYIGISTEPKFEYSVNTVVKVENPIVHQDLRPNIEIVIDQLYPMIYQ